MSRRNIEEILAEVRSRHESLPDHERNDDAWVTWIQTPEGIASILRDDINGVPPSQRGEIKLDRILKRCNNTRSL